VAFRLHDDYASPDAGAGERWRSAEEAIVVARCCRLLVLFAPVVFGCVRATAPAPTTSILGTWEAVSGEALGQEKAGKDAWGMRITFAEGKATWAFQMADGWQSFDGLCRIDPDGHSGWIDLGEPRSQDPARVARGIYRIDGDTLQISMDKERPLTFDQPALTRLKFKRFRQMN
jgi:uncharacterized protein (TIGR03067 family)